MICECHPLHCRRSLANRTGNSFAIRWQLSLIAAVRQCAARRIHSFNSARRNNLAPQVRFSLTSVTCWSGHIRSQRASNVGMLLRRFDGTRKFSDFLQGSKHWKPIWPPATLCMNPPRSSFRDRSPMHLLTSDRSRCCAALQARRCAARIIIRRTSSVDAWALTNLTPFENLTERNVTLAQGFFRSS